MTKNTLFSALTLMVLTAVCCPVLQPAAGYAGERESIRAAEIREAREAALRKGWLEQIAPDSLTIDDMSYPAGNATRYFDLNGNETGVFSLHKGQFVGFLLENNKLTEVYILEPDDSAQKPAATETVRPGSSSGGSEIILEDGVWRN